MEKVLERIILSYIFNLLFCSHLLNQDLCQETQLSTKLFFLAEGLEIRVIFFDVGKAFDKVWPEGLLLNPFPNDKF